MTAEDRVRHFKLLLARQYQVLDTFFSRHSGENDLEHALHVVFEAGAIAMVNRVEVLLAEIELTLPDQPETRLALVTVAEQVILLPTEYGK